MILYDFFFIRYVFIIQTINYSDNFFYLTKYYYKYPPLIKGLQSLAEG